MRILNEGARLADRYTLIRLLCSGSLSEVWLADDLASDLQVAIKFLSGEHAADERQCAALQREWRLGSRLMHPNIIRVFGVSASSHHRPYGSNITLVLSYFATDS